MVVLASWAVGLVLGGVSLGVRADRARHVPARRRDPRQRARRRPGRRPGADGPARAARQLGEFFGLYGLVGKGSQVIGQLLYGADPVPVLEPLGVGAYQVAVLSLLVTMLIGAWLVAPVRDAGAAPARSEPRRRRSG